MCLYTTENPTGLVHLPSRNLRISKGFNPPGSLVYVFFNFCESVEGRETPTVFHSQKPWCSLPAGRPRGWNLTERRQAEGMKCPLGQWATVVPVILSWSKPSPTTWKPCRLLHCPELVGGSGGARQVQQEQELPSHLLSGSWGTALPLQGAKVWQSPYFTGPRGGVSTVPKAVFWLQAS